MPIPLIAVAEPETLPCTLSSIVKSVAGLRISPLTATMPDIETTRLILHPVDSAEAGRIHNRTPTAEDQWAADYPFDGDIVALRAFVAATERDGEQRPFGYYRITQRSDRHAIGGIGFKGPPDNGVVEVGYGLAPSARGHGYATEALSALTTAAASQGVARVRADTAPDNVASRRTLERAGFVRVVADAGNPSARGLRLGQGSKREQEGRAYQKLDCEPKLVHLESPFFS